MILKNTEQIFSDLEQDLSELSSSLENADKQNPSVSGWSVGEQIDHIVQANTFMLESLAGPAPDYRPKKNNFLGKIILLTGRIPRGRGKAPKFVQPKNFSKDELQKSLDKAKGALADLKHKEEFFSNKQKLADHPYFGGFNAVEWLRFMEVHQRHHLKIIRDIIG